MHKNLIHLFFHTLSDTAMLRYKKFAFLVKKKKHTVKLLDQLFVWIRIKLS